MIRPTIVYNMINPKEKGITVLIQADCKYPIKVTDAGKFEITILANLILTSCIKKYQAAVMTALCYDTYMYEFLNFIIINDNQFRGV